MENLIYQKLQSAKKEGIVFKEIMSLFTLSNDDIITNEQDQFINPNEVSIIDYNYSSLNQLNEAIICTIPLKGKQLQLELIEVPPSFYNYNVVASDGQKLLSNKNIKHYRGVVKDDPNSIVAISFSNNETLGIIATDEGNFNLGLDSEQNKHIFYNERNLKQKMTFECDNISDNISSYL